MPQVAHPTSFTRTEIRSHRNAVIAALLALLATAAVVALIATNDGSSDSATGSIAERSQPAVRADGGPSESTISAAVGSKPSVGPSESGVAAAVAAGSPTSSDGPDESATASAISGR